MKVLYEWAIPSTALLVWIALILVVIPVFLRFLKRKAEQSRHIFDEILVSALTVPLILFLIGLGLSFFLDAIPSLPPKWMKYSNALLIFLFVLAGYLFLDRLMMEVLRRYSKKVDFIASSAGVVKTLYRTIILGFVFLIILDRLKITITPFLASLGIGGLVVALALQDTLANFFSGIFIFFDKPIRIGDYIMLESGQEGYVTQIGWRSTRIRMLPNNILVVPNTKLVSSQITNFYLPEPEMAVLVQVGISYQSDLEKVEKVTMLAVRGRDPDPKEMYFGLLSDTTSEGIGDKYKTVNLLKAVRNIPRDSEGKILARHAVVEALTEEMIRDRRVCVWGEDVAEQGGAYSATYGLLDIFGRERVFNTAISESAIIGTGIGASMAGLRPVVELMYIDFMLQAMDQIGNQAAKARYMFGGQYAIPMTIRATIGGGKGYAGQHSQSLESVAAHFPGLKVVAPSNAYDMKGLLKSAIRDDNPVFFIEHQWVYLEKTVVPLEEYTVPLGVGTVARKGSDITVVAYSNMVSRCAAAAEKLEREEGISVEIVDPRTLVPT